MSTKKAKFSNKDIKYMSLALELARARQGLTGENPSVGCVIVKSDKIISIGQTGYKGRPHAEYNAIKNSIESLDRSKMYVSLEPCNHYGQTPPCTKKIIRNKISEVCPVDIKLLFFTITQPTEGLSPVNPIRSFARFKARFINKWSL